MGVNTGYPGDLGRDTVKDGSESVLVLPLHELDHIADIISVNVQMPLRACAWQTAGRIRIEIGQVPAL